MAILKILGMGAVAMMIGGSAMAAEADNDAGATIGQKLAIEAKQDLDFGLIIPGNEAGDVSLSVKGERKCAAVLTCLGNDHHEARYSVTGEADQSYTISLPEAEVEITSGDNKMTIKSFSGSKANGTLVNGADDFTVGGLLEVNANQPAGRYTGTFTVAVNYQ